MGDRAIYVEDLSKRFYIGGSRDTYPTLRDRSIHAIKAPFRRAGKLLRGQATGAAELDNAIWALQNVSFEVRRGEALGIIGHNGAGKSTLLKILSRITEPTTGFADIYGRLGSLLEVGTGFHQELTGRENIYLNGAILGMRRAEIAQKFDEIVTFSEVEQFIDTPVKHYSSGMRMRLAFSVAAHLEPEILLIDEVLAVGDARFQKRCLAKMQDIGQQGRTVLFVSHNMQAVTRLCERMLWLDEGKVLRDGPSHQVVRDYLHGNEGSIAVREWSDPANAPCDAVVRLRAVRVQSEDGKIIDTIDIRKPVALEMEYEVLQPGYVILPRIQLFNDEGVHVLSTIDQDPIWRRQPRPQGCYVSKAWIPGNFLAEGTMSVGAGLLTPFHRYNRCYAPDAVAFQVIDCHDGDSVRGDWSRELGGAVRPMLQWDTQFNPLVD